MSARLLLRAVVNERLTAAAEEIFQVFERTILKYEEEASSSKQENERLRGLLLEFVSKQKADDEDHCAHGDLFCTLPQICSSRQSCLRDVSQSFICKEEAPAKRRHCEQELSLSICQRDADAQHIKEEDHELWAGQQHEEEQVEENKDAGDSCLPHSSAWKENEQEDVKPPQSHSSESEEQLQDVQETETVQVFLPFASMSQIQSERVQGGRESERNHTQTDQSQSSFIASGESTELVHLNSVVPEYRCQLCDKPFVSNHHLVNHAFRLHSKDADVLCAVCGKTLESTESLTVHLKSHKGSKCCHVCGKHCNSTTSLTEHMASHAGVKLHRCHVCGKECSRKGDLKIHMRIHTGEKPFCCSYCCKSFTHSGHLRKHMRSHTGERPYRCDICGRGFLQSTHLKYHLGTHTQKY